MSALWAGTLRQKVECLRDRRCLCGSDTFTSDVLPDYGDGIPDFGIEECANCGALWDFANDPPQPIRGPTA